MSGTVIAPTRITVAQFLTFEENMSRLIIDVKRLKEVSVNHSELIKELMSDAANTVSKAEMMAAVSTSRHQLLKARGDPNADDDSFDGGLSKLKKTVAHLEQESNEREKRLRDDNKRIEYELARTKKELFAMSTKLNDITWQLQSTSASPKKNRKTLHQTQSSPTSTHQTHHSPQNTTQQHLLQNPIAEAEDETAELAAQGSAPTREQGHSGSSIVVKEGKERELTSAIESVLDKTLDAADITIGKGTKRSKKTTVNNNAFQAPDAPNSIEYTDSISSGSSYAKSLSSTKQLSSRAAPSKANKSSAKSSSSSRKASSSSASKGSRKASFKDDSTVGGALADATAIIHIPSVRLTGSPIDVSEVIHSDELSFANPNSSNSNSSYNANRRRTSSLHSEGTEGTEGTVDYSESMLEESEYDGEIDENEGDDEENERIKAEELIRSYLDRKGEVGRKNRSCIQSIQKLSAGIATDSLAEASSCIDRLLGSKTAIFAMGCAYYDQTHNPRYNVRTYPAYMHWQDIAPAPGPAPLPVAITTPGSVQEPAASRRTNKKDPAARGPGPSDGASAAVSFAAMPTVTVAAAASTSATSSVPSITNNTATIPQRQPDNVLALQSTSTTATAASTIATDDSTAATTSAPTNVVSHQETEPHTTAAAAVVGHDRMPISASDVFTKSECNSILNEQTTFLSHQFTDKIESLKQQLQQQLQQQLHSIESNSSQMRSIHKLINPLITSQIGNIARIDNCVERVETIFNAMQLFDEEHNSLLSAHKHLVGSVEEKDAIVMHLINEIVTSLDNYQYSLRRMELRVEQLSKEVVVIGSRPATQGQVDKRIIMTFEEPKRDPKTFLPEHKEWNHLIDDISSQAANIRSSNNDLSPRGASSAAAAAAASTTNTAVAVASVSSKVSHSATISLPISGSVNANENPSLLLAATTNAAGTDSSSGIGSGGVGGPTAPAPKRPPSSGPKSPRAAAAAVTVSLQQQQQQQQQRPGSASQATANSVNNGIGVVAKTAHDDLLPSTMVKGLSSSGPETNIKAEEDIAPKTNLDSTHSSNRNNNVITANTKAAVNQHKQIDSNSPGKAVHFFNAMGGESMPSTCAIDYTATELGIIKREIVDIKQAIDTLCVLIEMRDTSTGPRNPLTNLSNGSSNSNSNNRTPTQQFAAIASKVLTINQAVAAMTPKGQQAMPFDHSHRSNPIPLEKLDESSRSTKPTGRQTHSNHNSSSNQNSSKIANVHSTSKSTFGTVNTSHKPSNSNSNTNHNHNHNSTEDTFFDEMIATVDFVQAPEPPIVSVSESTIMESRIQKLLANTGPTKGTYINHHLHHGTSSSSNKNQPSASAKGSGKVNKLNAASPFLSLLQRIEDQVIQQGDLDGDEQMRMKRLMQGQRPLMDYDDDDYDDIGPGYEAITTRHPSKPGPLSNNVAIVDGGKSISDVSDISDTC